MTNKTIDSRENYLKKLAKLGIQVELNHILNPALVTIHYLRKHHPDAKVYVIGEDVLKDELLDNGIRFASSPEETDVVVVSWDRDFHYRHLDFAYQAIKGALRLLLPTRIEHVRCLAVMFRIAAA